MNPEATALPVSDQTRFERALAWRGTIWLCALGLVLPCLLFVRRYPLPGQTRALHDLGGLSGFGTREYFGYIAGMVCLFASYLIAILHCRRHPVRAWRVPVVGAAVIAGCAMSFLYPVSAIDLFVYAVRSRLWTAYGENPIAVMPQIHPADPWLQYAGEWRGSVSPYGPLWNWIAAPGTWIGGDRIWVALAYQKALALASYLLIGLVALRIGEQRGHPVSAIVWLWNPLVLWEGVGNGHNDLVMLVPAVLAVWAWRTGKRRWVIPLLAAAFAIKYVALLLAPLASLALFRAARSFRAAVSIAVWSALGAAIVLAASLAPFFDLGAIRRSVQAQNAIMLTSPASMLANDFRDRADAAAIASHIRDGGTVLFIALAALQCLLTWRRPERWVRAGYEVLFAYLMVAAWTFRGWYVIWLLALAALLPLGFAAARAAVWSAGAMAAYVLYIWIWNWWGLDYFAVERIAVPLMFGPPLLLSAIELARMPIGRGHPPSSVPPVIGHPLG